MAEKQDKQQQEPAEKQQAAESQQQGAQQQEDAPTTPAAQTEQQHKPPEQAKPAAAQAPTGAGAYVVVADQVWVPAAKQGQRAVTRRRGDRVQLSAEQASRLAAGTRPAVVAASAVVDGDVDRAARQSLRAAAERRAAGRSRRAPRG